MEKFIMKEPFITIGQFLKVKGFISSGGEAKFFLCEQDVFINGDKITQRGKKIYPHDLVSVNGMKYKMLYD